MKRKFADWDECKIGMKRRKMTSTKRPPNSPKGTAAKVKPESRKLIVVFDKDAKSEVLAKRHLKKVDVTSWIFHFVRRNKKIEKIVNMVRKGTKAEMKAQVVTSRKGSLAELDCVYRKPVIEVFQHPECFDFTKWNWKWQDFWNITKANSKAVIMESNFDKKEMQMIIPELESDIGVLKRSVEQLLAKKTHNVIAVNTHPGHHASPKRAVNYCALNNNVIAARLIKKSNPNLKVGVIDIDVHPGDGTHLFVKQHRHLVDKFVSIHTTEKFWRSRMHSDLGANGVALRKDKKHKVTSQRFIRKIKQVLDTWNQDHLDVIIVSMGFDTLKCDPLAGDLGFQMLPVDFRAVGNVLSERPEQLLFIQEGGYDVNETATAFEYLVKGFREDRKSLGSGANSLSSPTGN